MNMHSFVNGFFPSAISRCALVLLVALAFGSSAFCGPIHDAAQQGDLAKVTAFLQSNPRLVSSRDDNGDTPLHLAAGQQG